MTVISADPPNLFDAGVAFFPSYAGNGFGLTDERAQMIYLDVDGIGWADESQSFGVDGTFSIRELRVICP